MTKCINTNRNKKVYKLKQRWLNKKNVDKTEQKSINDRNMAK